MRVRKWATCICLGVLAACAPVDEGTGGDPPGSPGVDGGSGSPGTSDAGTPLPGGVGSPPPGAQTRSPTPPRAFTARVEIGAVTLSWEPPLDDGGKPLKHHLVETLQTRGGATWSVFGPRPYSPDTRSARITGLVQSFPDARFVFRVVASNEAGDSPPLESLPLHVPPPVVFRRMWTPPLPGGTCTRLELQLWYPEPREVALEAEYRVPGTETFRPATLVSVEAGAVPLAAPSWPPFQLLWHHGADLPGYAGQVELRMRARVDGVLYGEDLGWYPLGVEAAQLIRPLELPTGAAPWAVRTGDFDRDGWTDLAVVNRTTRNLSLLLKSPEGSFSERVHFADLGTRAELLWSGDLDRDGALDLVAGGSESRDLRVLHGRGDGTLVPAVLVPTGGWVHALDGADVDGDGDVDLVTVEATSGQAHLLRGRGDGTFEAPLAVAELRGARWLALADFDADGHQDLVLAAQGAGGGISYARGEGDGRFTRVGTFGCELLGAGKGPLAPDGRLHVLTLCGAEAPLHPVLRAHALSPTGVTTRVLVEALEHRAQGVEVGDLNADGRPDLVLQSVGVGDWGAGAVTVLLAQADGTYAPGSFLPSNPPLSVALADLDADGDLDVVSAGAEYKDTPERLEVLLGQGDGTLVRCQDSSCRASPMAVTRDLLLEDLDGDGRKDLVVAHRTVSVRLGLGDGTFQPAREQTVPRSTPLRLAAADFDQDGRPDVVAGDMEGNVWLLRTAVDGTPGAPLLLGTVPALWRLAIADFNRDGRPDIVGGRSLEGGPMLLLSGADGAYQRVQPRPSWGKLTHVAPADVNLDGRADLVLGAPDTPLRLLVGLGDGTFRDGPETGMKGGVALVADLTGEGHPDVLTTRCELLPGLGPGFGAPLKLLGHPSCDRAWTGDWDADGQLDLGTTSSWGTAQAWRAIGTGVFVPLDLGWSSFFGPRSPVAADLNGDGADDLVSDSWSGSVQRLMTSVSAACVECSATTPPLPAEACFP